MQEVAEVSSTIETKANGLVVEEHNTQVPTPLLWDLETPNLYVAKTAVLKDNTLLDTYETTELILGLNLMAKRPVLKGFVCIMIWARWEQP
jgi:hypothetical protein